MLEGTFPNITAVDEHDEVIGYFQLFDAVAQGLTRRVSCVFVLGEDGDVLIQRRAAHVLSPNLLDFSAAGHVNEGDDYLTAAQEELFEELGVRDVPLKLLLPAFRTPGFFNGIFVATIPKETIFVTNVDEVSQVFWVSRAELQERLSRHPQQFSEPFLAVWPYVCDKIIL